MASTLSQEQENYVRMSLLLTGIAPRAVRTVFDLKFAPSCLDSSLKKEYNKLRDLQLNGIINQSQWNLLFPRFSGVPDSKTFDVTLMVMLVRNLTNHTPPRRGYDRLPSGRETTQISDLVKIKYYRNFLGHLPEDKIQDTDFEDAWNTVTFAIRRLGGLLMKQQCDGLKVKILDQSNQELILDIKHAKDEILELKKSMDSLRKDNENINTEMKKLEIYSKDTVPWNIRAQINKILDEWKDNDKGFIPTRATTHVLNCIRKNSSVTITASSGVGKTATLRHVALQMKTEGYDVLLVLDPGDIVKFFNPNEKTLFIIDDLCGKYSLDQIVVNVWEPFMARIKIILSNKLSKIIVACRLQVYLDDKFKSLSVFKSCVCNLSSKSMCLSKTEKKSIAEFYLKTEANEITDYYDLYECFPLLCKLYHDDPARNITDFFQHPFTVYEAEIDKLHQNGLYSKYCALVLCVIFNNNLNEEILTEEKYRAIIENTFEACRMNRGTSRLTLQDDLNSFIHTFLKKEQTIYKTIHDKIFDFLVFYFGQKIIHCLIENAHSGLISERFLLERQNSIDQFITIVPPKYHQMYIKRMIEDWSKGKVNAVFCNINMKLPEFRQKFLCYIKTLDSCFQSQLAHTSDVKNNDTALLLACFEGDISFIYWCLSYDVDINQCRNDETTPLYVAANEGWTEIVKIMLDIADADYDKCNNNGWSPLTGACSNGHADIVRMLLDEGADCNKCDSHGWSLVSIASVEEHTEIVKTLLDEGVDCNKCDCYGWSPVMRACSIGHTEIVRMLLDKEADYDKCDSHGWSPVLIACYEGYTEIVKMLIEKGAKYNKCNSDGWSPVMSAIIYGHTDTLRILMDKEADYNKCDNDGWSPLMRSCSDGETEIVRLLLDKEADYNKCDNDGWSPLMKACSVGHTEIVRLLLDKGADYDKCDNDGWSPLMRSCSDGETEIVRMLIDKGADYNKCDSDGWSSYIIACSAGHEKIVKMLFDLGVDYNKCCKNGWSPLMNACFAGHIDIVKMLLDTGADYNTRNSNDKSAAMIAFETGHTDVERLIKDHPRNEKDDTLKPTNSASGGDTFEDRNSQEESPVKELQSPSKDKEKKKSSKKKRNKRRTKTACDK